nr:hypothetical protein [uncultured Desulfobulbus sp.]
MFRQKRNFRSGTLFPMGKKLNVEETCRLGMQCIVPGSYIFANKVEILQVKMTRDTGVLMHAP